MLESTVESYFCAQVLAAGGMTRKMEWVGRPHAPDQLTVLPTVGVVLVELKRPGGSARPGQEREHARLRASGARVEVLSTFEEVDEFIVRMTDMSQSGIVARLLEGSRVDRSTAAELSRLHMVDLMDARRQKSKNIRACIVTLTPAQERELIAAFDKSDK